MRRRVSLSLSSLAAAAAAGLACAYYNGLYNAKQLASEAQRAERDGRRGEARSLWAQAAVKAESVAVRFPESRHRDDALLLQGTALSRIDACDEAVVPLHAALASSPDTAVRSTAALSLGQCYLVLEAADSAWSVLTPLVTSADSALASEALLWRGRAGIAWGRPSHALEDLRRTAEPRAGFDRGRAFIALGRAGQAAAALDSARRLSIGQQQWLDVLDSLGQLNPSLASTLVDSLVTDRSRTEGERARLLMADAHRWQPRDPSRAEARYRKAVEVGGDSVETRIAEVRLSVAEVRRTAELNRVAPLARRFEELMLQGGAAVAEAGSFATVLGATARALDSAAAPGGDLRLFRRAEEVRDTLRAAPLARRLFLRIPQLTPTSTLAPKALLAAAAIAPRPLADSLIDTLRTRYPYSPYTRSAFGQPAPTLSAIEDSLRQVWRALEPGAGGTGHPPVGDPRPEAPADPATGPPGRPPGGRRGGA